MKKRLIALMVAGIVTTATLSGCARESVNEIFVGDPIVNDGHIIIKQNDSQVLHKGDFYGDVDGSNNSFKFNYGEDFLSNAEHSAYFEELNKECYDEKCEECFDLNQ